MNFSAFTGFSVLAGLTLMSAAAGPYGDALRATRRSDVSLGKHVAEVARTITGESVVGSGRERLSLAVLGGFRGLVADLIWLRAYIAWERQDAPLVASLVDLATTVDERPLCFWLNGARMIAYDFPAWEILRRAAGGTLAGKDRERITRQAATQALALLARAISAHPTNAVLHIEVANIQLNRLGDVEGAAATYRRAAEMPGAPLYAARLHGELLRRLGRKEEALAWLIQLYSRLPQRLESAGAALVLDRIRTLETELRVSSENRYIPAASVGSIDPSLTLGKVRS